MQCVAQVQTAGTSASRITSGCRQWLLCVPKCDKWPPLVLPLHVCCQATGHTQRHISVPPGDLLQSRLNPALLFDTLHITLVRSAGCVTYLKGASASLLSCTLSDSIFLQDRHTDDGGVAGALSIG